MSSTYLQVEAIYSQIIQRESMTKRIQRVSIKSWNKWDMLTAGESKERVYKTLVYLNIFKIFKRNL